MVSSLRAVAVAGVLFVILAGVGGDAQQGQQRQEPQQAGQSQPQPPPADQQQPVFRTGINFVRVDVIVTDKNGNTVSDLKQGDFEVVEEGKPQAIETFRLVKLDGGAVPGPDGPPKPIRTDSDEETEASRDDVRLFAIFLDDYHVRLGASLSARERIAQFVETQLGPSDMVGVMYPLESTDSVRMTRNHAAVVKGIQRFVGRKYDYKPTNEFEERYAYYPTEIVERIRNQVSLSAIKALIVHMGTLKEGRKALILVSEGFTNMLPPQMRDAVAGLSGSGNPQSRNPLAGLNDPNEDRAAFFANTDLQADLRSVYDAANRNNTAIYAVDPRGLTGYEFDVSENINARTDQRYLSSTMDTLRVLAENSDGRAIVNRNDLTTGLRQIVRDTSAYYLLGYNSTLAPSDGKFHEIKVRVKRPGVQVRARRGYWALTAEETVRALAPAKPGPPRAVDAAVAAVNQPSRARLIRTWIGTERGENGKTKMTFVWEPVPRVLGDGVQNVEQPARVSLTAAGPDGAPYFRGRVPAAALAPSSPTASSAAAGNGTTGANGAGAAAPRASSRVTFEAQPGKMQLRLSVEDPGSQVLDSEIRDITVPDLTSPQTALGTPGVFRARTVPELQRLKADPEAVPVASREFSRTDRLLVRVPAYGPANATPAITARLLNRTGQAIADLPVASAPSGSASQIDVPLAALPPGEYVVEIKATGADGEAKELVGFRVTGG